MDRELRVHRSIDCFCSGTTTVTLVKQGKDLIVGNIGDSRAILGTRDEDSCLISVQLTVDLKPNLPAEAERIRRYRGHIFSLQDELEVARVWLPNCDSPGLAMAQGFGDFCLKDYGLISVPDVFHRQLTERDEFIVMATDGIIQTHPELQVLIGLDLDPKAHDKARARINNLLNADHIGSRPDFKVHMFLKNFREIKQVICEAE